MSSAGMQYAVNHYAGEAEIAGRVGELLDLVSTELARDLLVLLQQFGERRAFRTCSLPRFITACASLLSLLAMVMK